MAKKEEQPNYVLPTDNDSLRDFSKTFKVSMMEHVVSSIEHALKNNLAFVELFQFKNSDFVITLQEKDYLTNLDHIFNFYLESEKYEFCTRVVRLQKLLKDGPQLTHEK